ncbi:sensor domain-containing diguanylate cyclase [Desulfolutivibrio sulfoxidireducens]|uniref:sensor domain-containing diguanylate cyclase n=1 Tax=Desulfolutivibrio sulfoxidireducens TaxID=2773299 RepID=UPI00159E9FE7|nr:diguanylate cyclase [Desulfolutivibrio sulfoxidireducens]QLA16608.1 diguanylate cyclase [Desulfolutivibrio sulfoxidireducens]QLA19510.1 diguanylate cyclase [Desulfolutivibrio sulfoxidireducens]
MSGKKAEDPFLEQCFFSPGNRCELYRAVFDSLPEQVAILDRRGRIREVNAGWERFARENAVCGLFPGQSGAGEGSGGVPIRENAPFSRSFEGENYLEVCRNATGQDSREAGKAAEGIRAVLDGRIERFTLEYPCHSPWEKRWFLLSATPLRKDGEVVGCVVSHLPITDRKLAELALTQSEKRLNEAQRLARVGSYERDVRTGMGHWSNELFRMMGFPVAPHSPSMAEFMLAVHPDDRERVRDFLRQAAAVGYPDEFEFRIVSAREGLRHISSFIEVERDAEGRAVRYHGAMVDVTRLKNVEAELIKLAATDELTGIHNRRRFLELLRVEVTRSARYGHPLSLAMLDIDNFKRINDSHGHAVGDEALRCLAATVSRSLRSTDVFGRLGGEEFAIVLTETGTQDAFATCRRIVRTVAGTGVDTTAGRLPLTVSMGLVTVQPGMAPCLAGDGKAFGCGVNPDVLLRQADEALYRAKAEGKNRVARCEAHCGDAKDSAPGAACGGEGTGDCPGAPTGLPDAKRM